MSEVAKTFGIGDATVTKIEELTLNVFTSDALFPGSDPSLMQRHSDKFDARSVDLQSQNVILSVHSWLVQTPDHTILIDTSTGNDKQRPYAPVFDQLNGPYLDRLAAAGVLPEAVDYVLLTHLHADHVGWNTRLVGGQWTPTFPNAKYIFSMVEQNYNESLAEERAPVGGIPDPALGPAVGKPWPLVYDDSVKPVIEAGLAQMIALGGEGVGQGVLDGFSFIPTPGHSVDHASIRFISRGEEALFSGDLMHHPLQVYETGLHSCFCEFPEAALRSRQWGLEHAAEHNALYFSTHFGGSSAGRISRKGDRFEWQFA